MADLTLAITPANRDAVAQTAAGTVLGAGDGFAVAPLGAAPDQRIQSHGPLAGGLSHGLLPAPVHRLLHDRLRAGGQRDALNRALAQTPLSDAPCAFGGSAAVALDDADGSGQFSPGDTLEMRFTQCAEVNGAPVDGLITMRFDSYTDQPLLAATGQISFIGLSVTAAGETWTMDGTMRFDQRELDPFRYRHTFTALTPLTTRTIGARADTVTLAPGYSTTEEFDDWNQRSTVTIDGSFSSNALGGQLRVRTTDPVVHHYADLYPRSGALEVKGRTGTLTITVQSSSRVQVQLDADDNGSFEDSRLVDWSWLV